MKKVKQENEKYQFFLRKKENELESINKSSQYIKTKELIYAVNK